MSNTATHAYRLTRKGQVTIPKVIRDHLGITEGDSVVFEIDGDQITMSKVFDREAYLADLDSVAGTGNEIGLTADELVQLTRSYDFIAPGEDDIDAA